MPNKKKLSNLKKMPIKLLQKSEKCVEIQYKKSFFQSKLPITGFLKIFGII